MAAEDLRTHDHSRQGSGGFVDFGDRINSDDAQTKITNDGLSGTVGGATTVLDSGTETSVQNNTNTRVATTVTDVTTAVDAIAVPADASEISADFEVGSQILTPSVMSSPVWDDSAGNWDVGLFQDTGSAIDVKWKLYEVA